MHKFIQLQINENRFLKISYMISHFIHYGFLFNIYFNPKKKHLLFFAYILFPAYNNIFIYTKKSIS